MCVLTTAAAGTAAAAAAGSAAAAGGTAAATTAASSWLTYASMAAALAGAGVSAYSSIQQGKSAQAQAEYNAKQAEAQAADAQLRGGIAANQKRQEVRRAVAAQQTQLAANGVETSSGSALSLMSDTSREGELDAQTAYANAIREAYGYQSQATSYRFSGKSAMSNAYGQATGSLLSGAGSALKSWSVGSGSSFGGTSKKLKVDAISHG